MIPTVPFALTDLQNLDVDKVNANLRAIHRDVDDDMNRRYFRCSTTFELDGITSASALVLRQFFIRRPGASNAVQIESMELDISATAGEWTATPSDSLCPPFTTVSGYGSTGIALDVPSSVADVTVTLSCGVASTITGGRLVVHLRCDRWHQGDTETRYLPTTIDASKSTAVTTLNTEFSAIAAAVVSDVAAQKDLRCDVAVARNLTAGQTLAYRVPGADADGNPLADFRVDVYVVAAVTQTARVTVTDGSGSAVVDVVGGGATVVAHGGAALASAGGTNPADPTQDIVVTLENHAGAGSVLLVYAVIWYR